MGRPAQPLRLRFQLTDLNNFDCDSLENSAKTHLPVKRGHPDTWQLIHNDIESFRLDIGCIECSGTSWYRHQRRGNCSDDARGQLAFRAQRTTSFIHLYSP